MGPVGDHLVNPLAGVVRRQVQVIPIDNLEFLGFADSFLVLLSNLILVSVFILA